MVATSTNTQEVPLLEEMLSEIDIKKALNDSLYASFGTPVSIEYIYENSKFFFSLILFYFLVVLIWYIVAHISKRINIKIE